MRTAKVFSHSGGRHYASMLTFTHPNSELYHRGVDQGDRDFFPVALSQEQRPRNPGAEARFCQDSSFWECVSPAPSTARAIMPHMGRSVIQKPDPFTSPQMLLNGGSPQGRLVPAHFPQQAVKASQRGSTAPGINVDSRCQPPSQLAMNPSKITLSRSMYPY